MQPPPPQPLQLLPRAPSPQSFGGGAAFSLMQGIDASSSSSPQAAAAAARALAAEQMAYEDAWKASNPDFRTPFASVEDAVTRLLPYHVLADYEEEDGTYVDASGTEKSCDERWDKDVTATYTRQIEEFEKHVVSFNVMARQRADGTMRGEELLMLERALLQDEHRQTEHLRAAVLQERQQQQQQQQQQQAARLALTQAQVASAWPLVQPTTQSGWQQALAAAAAAVRGDGIPGQMTTAPAVPMHPQLDPSAVGVWLLMQQQQQQHLQQQQQQSSSGQAGSPALWQEQADGGQAAGGTAGGGGMAQPWWVGGAPQRRDQ